MDGLVSGWAAIDAARIRAKAGACDSLDGAGSVALGLYAPSRQPVGARLQRSVLVAPAEGSADRIGGVRASRIVQLGVA